MSNQLATQSGDVIANLVLNGDLSKMNDQQKVQYYMLYCERLGLNPLSQPFKILNLDGKLMMYATKDCAEQLRKMNIVSVVEMEGHLDPDETYVVTIKLKDKDGKTDISTGVVFIGGLKGNAIANAKMKAETKAKRRGTLSISGLSLPDESEIETIEGKATVMEFPAEPTKRPLTDRAFGEAVEKIKAGDVSIIGKLRATCFLNEEQIKTLVSFEDGNTVPA